MKTWRLSLSICGVLIGFAATADTLNLTDPSGIPVPPEAHVDAFWFPPLLDSSNPITNLTIAYDADYSGMGGHEIVSATLLFDPAQVASISDVLSTPAYYGASVTFSVPVTAVSDEFAPAFWAVHADSAGASSLIWTASYLDGSQQQYYFEIIPEPSTVSMFVLSGLLICAGCRCRTSRCTE